MMLVIYCLSQIKGSPDTRLELVYPNKGREPSIKVKLLCGLVGYHFGCYEQGCYEHSHANVCGDMCFHFSGEIPKRGIPEPYGNSVFNCLRKCQTVSVTTIFPPAVYDGFDCSISLFVAIFLKKFFIYLAALGLSCGMWDLVP